MAVTAKRLAQTALSTALSSRYTTPAGTTTQITEIWLCNTNTTTVRKVQITLGGTGTANNLIKEVEIPANGTVVLSDCKLVLTAGQVLYAKQDVGADVAMNVFGIEEG